MPRHNSRTSSNPNKIMTRSAAAAAAVAASAAATSPSSDSVDLSTNNHPSTSTIASSSSSPGKVPPRPEPAASPAKCAICLGDLSNRCYTNSCIHQFCFGCLLEWSKIKAECPLCKSNFQSIYHNIRNNDDYDEYHIPPPAPMVPHLSIRLTADALRAHLPAPFRFDEPIPIPSVQVGVLGPPSPFHDHGYSFQRMVRERERQRRQHNNNSSYIRILEMGPFSEPRALDFVNYSTGGVAPGRSVLDNPFYSDEPELFGSVDDNESRIATEDTLRGYQSRKRVYDRAQFVQPSASASLHPAGTVFCPSIEYFHTHPSAMSRVAPWLYREIMAVMGINRSRSEMGYVYDIINGLLNRYDIRSRDFREMVNSHLGIRTRHFQHEFYHFLISGRSAFDYDRVAQYGSMSTNCTSTATSSSVSASNSNNASAPHTSTNDTPVRSTSPVTITIDSSDSDSDSNSSVEELDVDGYNFTSREPRQMRRVFLPEIPNPDGTARTERPPPQPPIVLTTIPSPPPCPVNYRNFFQTLQTRRAVMFQRALDLQRASERNVNQRSSSTMVPNPLGSSESSLSGRRFPWELARQPPTAHLGSVPIPTMAVLEDWETTLQSLNRFGSRPTRADDSTPPLDGHRYTPQSQATNESFPPMMPLVSAPMRTTDHERPRCPVETGHPVSPYIDPIASRPDRCFDNMLSSSRRNNPLACSFGRIAHPLGSPTSLSRRNHSGFGTTDSVGRTDNHADSARNLNTAGPFTVDLSTPHTEPHSSPSSVKQDIKSRPKTPPRRISPAPSDDDDDIEMLGIHPVVKPPPLAIITLSSDDEEENTKTSKPKVEVQEPKPGPSCALTSSAVSASVWEDNFAPIIEMVELDDEVVMDYVQGLSSTQKNCRSRSTPRMTDTSKTREYSRKWKNYRSSKNKHAKKSKYSTPEFIDTSSSSSSSSSSNESEEETRVERTEEKNNTKIKRKKPQIRNSGEQVSKDSPSDKQDQPVERFSYGLARHKRIPLSPFLSRTFEKKKDTSTKPYLGDSDDDDSDSDYSPPSLLPKKASSSVINSFNNSGYLGRNKTMTKMGKVSSSTSIPTTSPGIPMLDLRKLIDEKKKSREEHRNIGVSLRIRSHTVVRPSQVSLPRWESDASEAEPDIDVNDHSHASDSDWNKKDEPDDSDEEPNGQSDHEDSSSSDTQYNSKRSEQGNSSRGSFYIPNRPQSSCGSTGANELLRTSTSDGTLDLRLGETLDPMEPWRNDAIVGRFDQDAVGGVDLLDLSLGSTSHPSRTTPPTLSLYETDLLQHSGTGRSSMDEGTSEATSRSRALDWFADMDSFKWEPGWIND